MYKRACLAAAAVAAGAALSALTSLPASAAGPQTLTASLVSGTQADFATTSGGSTGVTCSASAIRVTVSGSGAAAPSVSVTSLTFSACTSTITGVTGVNSVTATALPWSGSPAAGGQVTLTGSGGSTGITLALQTALGSITCAYQAASVTATGTFSPGGGITFTTQQLSLSAGPAACPRTIFYSAQYGPFVKAS